MMMQQMPPSAQSGENYQKMASRIPSMSDEQLQTFVNTGFGALALTEITRRNRLNMQQQAAQAAQNQPTGTMADAEIQKMMQAKMASGLAGDDRVGLNNIIAQAEQGGLEFGQPTQGMAGGGIVAFSDGKYPVREDRSRFAETFGFEPSAMGDYFDIGNVPAALGRTVGSAFDFFSRQTPIERKQEEMEDQLQRLEQQEKTLALRGLELDPESKIALKGLRTTLGKDTGPKKTIDTSRLFPKEEVDAEKARVAGAGKKDSAGVGKAGVESLFTTDPAKILDQRKKLLEAQGIGAFGEDVEKMLGESEEKTKKGLEGLKLTRAATAGAKAVGGRGRERKEGLEALAAAVSGAAEGAGSVAERELEVQSKFDEFRMKQAMAKDAYERGEVGKAQELAMSAQKDQRDFQLKKEELDILRSYRDQQGKAALAKASQQYGVKPGDVVNATKQSDLLRQRLSVLMLDPENEVNAAEIQEINQDLQMLKAIASMGTLRGIGLQIEDVPDEQ
jgi:hypothetical protein